jgi:hypothetical protein
MMNRPKTLLYLFLALIFAFFTTAALAQELPAVGEVRVESTSIAAGIGVSWGDGVLKFEEKEYKFSVKGLSLVDVGISKVSAMGLVYNLKKIEDFPGTYTAIGAGIALAGGGAGTRMKNQNDVYISVSATQKGIKFTLAAEGMTVKMK